MKMIAFWPKSIGIVLLALWLQGCSSSGGQSFVPTLSIDVKLEANQALNVFEDGQSRPVVVRIYQLNDIGSFEKASYINLFENEQSALAASMVDVKSLGPILPGEQREWVLGVQQQARYLAVFAEFSNYETSVSKSYVALVDDPESYPVYIQLINNQIAITQPVSDPWWKL